jgi:hypothetical protein
MVTRQQHADAALQAFQQNRDLTRERMAKLLEEFFAPYVSEDEYNSAMRRVSEEMDQ